MTHWPVLRNGTQLAMGAPSTDSRAMATSGPIIQGMGVLSHKHPAAAANAISSVPTVRKACGRLKPHSGGEEADMNSAWAVRQRHLANNTPKGGGA